jgi:hypothetical protein
VETVALVIGPVLVETAALVIGPVLVETAALVIGAAGATCPTWSLWYRRP